MFQDFLNYDRKQKRYDLIVTGGEIVGFPSGPVGKLDALRYWINDQSPALHDHVMQLIDSNPHISQRAYKAAEIALSGMIRPVGQGHMVVSSKGDGEYLVSADEYGRKACGCFDYQDNENPVYISADGDLVQVCKHVLAVDMWLRFIAPY